MSVTPARECYLFDKNKVCETRYNVSVPVCTKYYNAVNVYLGCLACRNNIHEHQDNETNDVIEYDPDEYDQIVSDLKSDMQQKAHIVVTDILKRNRLMDYCALLNDGVVFNKNSNQICVECQDADISVKVERKKYSLIPFIIKTRTDYDDLWNKLPGSVFESICYACNFYDCPSIWFALTTAHGVLDRKQWNRFKKIVARIVNFFFDNELKKWGPDDFTHECSDQIKIKLMKHLVTEYEKIEHFMTVDIVFIWMVWYESLFELYSDDDVSEIKQILDLIPNLDDKIIFCKVDVSFISEYLEKYVVHDIQKYIDEHNDTLKKFPKRTDNFKEIAAAWRISSDTSETQDFENPLPEFV